MRSFILLLAIFLIVSCKPKVNPIEYGTDGCEFCKMTIMDKRYGTEVVTSKGKVFKFDAIECMINYLHKNKDKSNEFKLVLVTPYTTPETLIEANQTFILRSKNLPSPMGAYLTAFPLKKEAEDVQNEKGGDIYNWNELFSKFKEISKKEMVFDE